MKTITEILSDLTLLPMPSRLGSSASYANQVADAAYANISTKTLQDLKLTNVSDLRTVSGVLYLIGNYCGRMDEDIADLLFFIKYSPPAGERREMNNHEES